MKRAPDSHVAHRILLRANGTSADIRPAGGAALIIQGIGNRPTADIHASYAAPITYHDR